VSAHAPYEVDWTGRWHGVARGVERPGDVTALAALLAAADRDGTPMTVAGGRTGLVGGAVPPPDGRAVVLSTERLTELGEVDVAGGCVLAGAGVPLAAVQRAAAAHGLEYGVDLAARDTATIGGTVATDAGGVHVVGAGSTRAQVLGLQAVLADGTVLDGLDALPKTATGPDLAGVLCGSEGVLAVVTAARLWLRPRPAAISVARLPAPTVEAALELGARARRLPGLRALEWVAALPGVAPHVLVEVAGPADGLAALDPPEVVEDAPGRAALWAARGAASETAAEAAARAGRVLHKLDVAVPVPGLPALLAQVSGLGAEVLLWVHLAEGNLHLNLLGERLGEPDAGLDERVLRLVVAAGGSPSSEHGVGRAKAALLWRLQPERLALLRRLKVALDPRGTLNPGVLLP